MTIQEQISQAIKTKRKMNINYTGEGIREISPHVLFGNDPDAVFLDAYQVSGHSNHSEASPGWRQFSIHKIIEVEVLAEIFNLAEGYNPEAPKYHNAIIKVE